MTDVDVGAMLPLAQECRGREHSLEAGREAWEQTPL